MMPTIAMATSRQSAARSLHPDTLGWLTENDPLPVVGWRDQVVDALGHDPRSEYVEIFWLPIMVPSCTLAARRLAGWLDTEPAGFEVSVSCLASSLGLGSGLGRNARVNRTPGRLVDFGIARIDGKAFAVRRSFPPLAARQINADTGPSGRAARLPTRSCWYPSEPSTGQPMSAVLFEPAVGSDFSPISPEVSRSGGVQVFTVARRIVLAGAKGGQGSTTVAAAMAVFAFTVMDAGRIEQLPGPEERTITVAVVRGPCYLASGPWSALAGRNPMGSCWSGSRAGA